MGRKEISIWRSLNNNFFAIKMCFELSKCRVIHAIINIFFDNVVKLFYSIYFLKFVIHSIESEESFKIILKFITISSVFLFLISFYGGYYSNYVKPLSSNIIFETLYQKVYTKARNVELGCFEDTYFYNKYMMALEEANNRLENTVDNVFSCIIGLFTVAVTFYSLIIIDPFSIVFILFPIVGNLFFGSKMSRIYSKRYQDDIKNKRKSDYVNRILHLSDYAKEIRLSNLYNLMKRKYKETIDSNMDIVQRYSKKAILNTWLQDIFITVLGYGGIIIYTFYRTMVTKSIGIAELAITYSIMATSSITLFHVFNSFIKIIENGMYIDNLRVFLEYKEKIPEDQNGIIPDKYINTIEFKNVSFYYQEDQPIIKNLSFTITGKSKIAFVGHNGAGKSTIMKLLFRLYDPKEGDIYVNGINIKKYNLKEYRKLFATAMQDDKILAFSVKDNIFMGKEFESITKEEEVLNKVLNITGMNKVVSDFPYGVDTILTKEFEQEGVVLSGGQYQKLAIARIFAKDSPIQVFDEPTSALDPIAEFQMYRSIINENMDKTVLIISHRLSSVCNVDMIFMLEEGQIIEQGTHVELIKLGGTYATMYYKQVNNYSEVNEGDTSLGVST